MVKITFSKQERKDFREAGFTSKKIKLKQIGYENEVATFIRQDLAEAREDE